MTDQDRGRGPYKKISIETRGAIVRMYTNGVTKTRISNDLAVPRSSVNSVIKNFIETGNVDPKNKGGAYNIKCNGEIRVRMEQLLQEECTRTLSFLQSKILEEFEVRLCLATIRANLKVINFSLKQTTAIPERRNAPDNIEKRYDYAMKFDRLSGQFLRSRFIFVDEAGFCVSMRRNRGWSIIGTQANVVVPTLRGRNFSVCAAISIEGVVHSQVRDRAYKGNLLRLSWKV